MDLLKLLFEYPVNYTSENILRDFLVYDEHSWYKYDTAAFGQDVLHLVEQVLTRNIAYLENEEKIRVYSQKPGAVLADKIEGKATPYGHKLIIKAFLWNNIAIFLLITPLNIRLIMFIEKDFINSTNIFPTPDLMMYNKLTGGFEDWVIPEFYFVNPEIESRN